nr:hypothetical protein [uncultured Rhodopila sp.]
MTNQELAAIVLNLQEAGYGQQQIMKGMAAVREAGATDSDDVLAFALGAILGDEGERWPVEPGFVAALLVAADAP